MGKLGDKIKAIGVAVDAIDKQFGKGVIRPLEGELPHVGLVPVVSTGSAAVDEAIGVGGLPRGRVSEYLGASRSGKTTLALATVAACQKAGGVCAWIDVKHDLDISYARTIGCDLGQLLVSQPDSAEQGLEIVDQLARTGAIDLIVVDDVNHLHPRGDIEGEDPDYMAGLRARLLSQALRKITAVCAKQNVIALFLHEPRRGPGVVFSGETVAGANALKFYTSVRIDLARVDGVNPSIKVRAKVLKNKVAAPFREAEIEIGFGRGIVEGVSR